MNIIDLLSGLLNRDLSDEEAQMLLRITPEGMAKLNCDISKGVQLEYTMKLFTIVFRAMRKRREGMFRGLPAEVKAVIARVGRPVTTAEMIYLEECYHSGHLKNLIDPTGALAESFDLEGCAKTFQINSLLRDADCLSNSIGNHVEPCQMAPMSCPKDLSKPTFQRTAGDRPSVCFSPVVCWFHEIDVVPLEVANPEVSVLLTGMRPPRIRMGGKRVASSSSSSPEAAPVPTNATMPRTESHGSMCRTSSSECCASSLPISAADSLSLTLTPSASASTTPTTTTSTTTTPHTTCSGGKPSVRFLCGPEDGKKKKISRCRYRDADEGMQGPKPKSRSSSISIGSKFTKLISRIL